MCADEYMLKIKAKLQQLVFASQSAEREYYGFPPSGFCSSLSFKASSEVILEKDRSGPASDPNSEMKSTGRPEQITYST